MICLYWFSLPSQLFNDPYSTVLEDRRGSLLSAKIAEDGQWRFPQIDSVPEKFSSSLILFEDKKFHFHPGFNPWSLIRAWRTNLEAGRTVNGGSTLSMQVIRLSRKNRPRTWKEKFIEIILATRLELRYSKNEILAMYASHAPYGRNVVGLEAASWKYFGTSPFNLSWAQSAMLAVLPNSPSLIYPGKNENRLLQKRNRLLKKLLEANKISETDYRLAINEPLPDKPVPVPRFAPHLLERLSAEGKEGKRITSTIDLSLQQRVNDIIERHHHSLTGIGIHNAAAIVIETKTGKVLSYVGNTSDRTNSNGNDVDIITAPRSTGSILKPVLFAAMLNEGSLLPGMLVPDVPTQIGNYQPKNFMLNYDGAIQAKKALARSLNVPAVKLLQRYNVNKFHGLLKRAGMRTLRFSPDHYGLSLILGGAEGSLWDITGMYASMARGLVSYNDNGHYFENDFHQPVLLEHDAMVSTKATNNPVFSAGSLWQTFEAILEVARPDQEGAWKLFSSSKKIAWKTGTSFGFRDGWAIGTTPGYVVGVWTGNASGEGKSELTGISTAAPILFDIFSSLPASSWFTRPTRDMSKTQVCKKSGFRASELCPDKEIIWTCKTANRSAVCPYHQLVHLDKSERYQVTSECCDVSEMVHKSWFVLPPSMEWFYRMKDPSYQLLPPYASGCQSSEQNMEFIYPKETNQIYVPIEINGSTGKVIFEIAHRRTGAKLFWHLDDSYLGTTSNFHQFALNPIPGKHTVTVVDDQGESLVHSFEVLAK